MIGYLKRFLFVALFAAIVIGGVEAWERVKASSFNPSTVIGLALVGGILIGLFVMVWVKWDLTARSSPPINSAGIQAEQVKPQAAAGPAEVRAMAAAAGARNRDLARGAAALGSTMKRRF